MSDWAIEARGLRKSFKGQSALAGLNLEVPSGSIFGFLGRNGAGKTTTIRLLMGLLKADEGEARVLGLPAEDLSAGIEIRRRVGFVTEDKELYPNSHGRATELILHQGGLDQPARRIEGQ